MRSAATALLNQGRDTERDCIFGCPSDRPTAADQRALRLLGCRYASKELTFGRFRARLGVRRQGYEAEAEAAAAETDRTEADARLLRGRRAALSMVRHQIANSVAAAGG